MFLRCNYYKSNLIINNLKKLKQMKKMLIISFVFMGLITNAQTRFEIGIGGIANHFYIKEKPVLQSFQTKEINTTEFAPQIYLKYSHNKKYYKSVSFFTGNDCAGAMNSGLILQIGKSKKYIQYSAVIGGYVYDKSKWIFYTSEPKTIGNEVVPILGINLDFKLPFKLTDYECELILSNLITPLMTYHALGINFKLD